MGNITKTVCSNCPCAASGTEEHPVPAEPSLNVDSDKTSSRVAAFLNQRRCSVKDGTQRGLQSLCPQTAEEREILLKSLNSHFILMNLSEDIKQDLVTRMAQVVLGTGEVLFTQGQRADAFYVLLAGRAMIVVDGERKGLLTAGSTFGELALLNNLPRSATVKSLGKCVFWGLAREEFKQAVDSINELNYLTHKELLRKVPFFEALNEEQLSDLVAALVPEEVSEGTAIVTEGDKGDQMYIIKAGSANCSVGGEFVRKLGAGDYFGEMALLYRPMRTATVQANEAISLLCISRAQMEEVFGGNVWDVNFSNLIQEGMRKNEYLNLLLPEQIEALVNNAVVVKYNKGEVLANVGDHASKVLIVLEGKIRAKGQSFDRLQPVNERVVSKSTLKYKERLFAATQALIAEISKNDIEKVANVQFSQLNEMSKLIGIFQKVPVFKSLTLEYLIAIVKIVRKQNFKPGTTIVKERTPGNELFIIKSGTVDILKNGTKVRSMLDFSYFGERSILLNEKRSATVVARNHVTCWVMTKEDLLPILDGPILKLLVTRMTLQDDQVGLKHLLPLRKLGEGSFGTVFLCSHKDKRDCLYALKTISQSTIARHNLYDHLIQEKNVLQEIDHGMIMKLVKTFKDKHRAYFLNEFVQGVELFRVLRKLRVLSQDHARFYSVCIILILQHLHERKIVYRDLKPENVMVDQEGYLKLVDFGAAKVLSGRTYTIIGTPHYMAPEVLLSKGYSLNADLWSFGVMLYEFLYGDVPFGAKENSPKGVYSRIFERNLVFPKKDGDFALVNALIQTLLDPKPYLRCNKTIRSLRLHSWFSGVFWDDFYYKMLTAPYIPHVARISQLEVSMDSDLFNVITLEESLSRVSGQPGKNAPSYWEEDF